MRHCCYVAPDLMSRASRCVTMFVAVAATRQRCYMMPRRLMSAACRDAIRATPMSRRLRRRAGVPQRATTLRAAVAVTRALRR